MIRYVHIGSQILDGRNQFALFDTERDQFVMFLGDEVFNSVADLEAHTVGMRNVDRERYRAACRHHDDPETWGPTMTMTVRPACTGWHADLIHGGLWAIRARLDPLSPCHGDPLPGACEGRNLRTDPMVGDWFLVECGRCTVVGTEDVVRVEADIKGDITKFVVPVPWRVWGDIYTHNVTLNPGAPPACTCFVGECVVGEEVCA